MVYVHYVQLYSINCSSQHRQTSYSVCQSKVEVWSCSRDETRCGTFCLTLTQRKNWITSNLEGGGVWHGGPNGQTVPTDIHDHECFVLSTNSIGQCMKLQLLILQQNVNKILSSISKTKKQLRQNSKYFI